MAKDISKKANKLRTQIEDNRKLLSKLKEAEVSGMYSIYIQNGVDQSRYTEMPRIKLLSDVFIQQYIMVVERKLKALENELDELKEL